MCLSPKTYFVLVQVFAICLSYRHDDHWNLSSFLWQSWKISFSICEINIVRVGFDIADFVLSFTNKVGNQNEKDIQSAPISKKCTNNKKVVILLTPTTFTWNQEKITFRQTNVSLKRFGFTKNSSKPSNYEINQFHEIFSWANNHLRWQTESITCLKFQLGLQAREWKKTV